MKKYLVLALFLSVFSFLFCTISAKADKRVVIFTCDLHCQGCCDKIMKNIAFERGVKDLVCDLPSKTVTVTYDANKTDVPTLQQAFAKIGKPATVKEPQKAPATTESNSPDAISGATIIEQ